MIRQVARRFGWGRNPLRRTSDRVEGLLAVLLAAALLAGTPLLSWRAAQARYRAELKTLQWERQHVFASQAVLVEDTGTADDAVGTRGVLGFARAVWTAPDGSARTGLVQTTPGDRAGTRIAVWVDDDGGLRPEPGRGSPMTRAVLVGVAVQLSLIAALAGLRRAGRALLDRHRYRSWQEEWTFFGVIWRRDRR